MPSVDFKRPTEPQRSYVPLFFGRPPATEQSPRYSAFHESSHVVTDEDLARQLPYPVRPCERVFIRSRDEIIADPHGALGGVDYPAIQYHRIGTYVPLTCAHLGSDSLRRMEERAFYDAVVAYAGPIAEARLRHRPLFAVIDDVGQGDYERVLNNTADWAKTYEDQVKLIKKCRRQASRQVSRNWHLITRLAGLLLVEGEIEGKRVRTLLDQWRSEAST